MDNIDRFFIGFYAAFLMVALFYTNMDSVEPTERVMFQPPTEQLKDMFDKGIIKDTTNVAYATKLVKITKN